RLWRRADWKYCPDRRSCEEILRFNQCLRKDIHLLARVVERERSSAACGHSKPGEQRHHAVGAGANRNTGTVDDGGDVVGMRPFDFEGDDWPFLLRSTKNAKGVDLAQPLGRIFQQRSLMRPDARLADGI